MKMLKMLSLPSLALFSMMLALSGSPQAAQSSMEAGACAEQAACGRCGDGVCVKSCGETPATCPADCGGSTSSF